jgi:soluble lytic murein transglycosylase-like protein
MLLLGTLALSPAAARAESFSCKDARGDWVFGNRGHVAEESCVGRKRKIPLSQSPPARHREESRATTAAEARAILLAPSAYRDHVQRAAESYRLPVELLHAVMAVESGYNPVAVSRKGAAGLMQLMPGTAREMYVSDVWSPSQNIDGGARYLRVLANQYQGDLVKTLAAYNAGPDAVQRAGGVPNIPETREYVRKVLALYEKLKSRNAKG